MKRVSMVVWIALFVWSSNVYAGDWPQYLGPGRNAVSSETGLAKEWPEDGPKVLWTVPLGLGYGGPAVVDGKVYLLDRIGAEQDVMRCLDFKTGQEEWRFAYDAPGRLGHPGSRSVPSVDDERIYTCGPHGDVYCFDRTTHKPIWKKSLKTDFGPEASMGWGFGQNPLLYEDMIIIAPMTSEVGVAALDKKTGDTKWTSPPMTGRGSYVSPGVYQICGEDQIVMINASNEGRRRGRSRDSEQTQDNAQASNANKGVVVGLNPKTGEQLWSYYGWQCGIPIPNMVTIGDGRFFITGGYQAGSAMIRIEKKDGKFVVEELFKTADFGVHCHPPILYKDYLYGHCSTNETRDGLVCMNLDGEVQWKTGSDPLFDKGGLLLADGRIYSVDGNEGYLYMIDPSPEGFKPIAKAKLLGGREIWAPLTLVDGNLLIRDQSQIKCVDIR